MTDCFKNETKDRLSGFSGQILFDESLSKHTHYRIGGSAKLLLVPSSLKDLELLKPAISSLSLPFTILGGGSNVLASDKGFDGAVIKVTGLNKGVCLKEENDRQVIIETGASLTTASFVNKCCDEGWSGAEFLAGIPGALGGALCMNAGTATGEVKDRVTRVEVFSIEKGELRSIDGAMLVFGYRSNGFLNANDIVCSMLWRLERGDPQALKVAVKELLDKRKASQPVELPSCGSVFKNPKQLKAWQVIEKVGLKGVRRGDAQFSEKHCNFIVNIGEATAADVHWLIAEAKHRASKIGIELEEEVRFLGEFVV
jgi:UDP-N-acetylmuramate dehydrogenase